MYRLLHRLSLSRFVHGGCSSVLLHRVCRPTIMHRRMTLMHSCNVFGYTGFLQTETFNLVCQSRCLGSLNIRMRFSTAIDCDRKQTYMTATSIAGSAGRVVVDLCATAVGSGIGRVRRRFRRVSVLELSVTSTAFRILCMRAGRIGLKMSAPLRLNIPARASVIAYPSFLFPHLPQHLLQFLLFSLKLALFISRR